MRFFSMVLALVLALPSISLAAKIKDINISNKHPNVGETVTFSVKVSGDVSRAKIEFTDVGIKQDMAPVIGKNKWEINWRFTAPGEKKYKISIYDKKENKDDSEKGSIHVGSTKSESRNSGNPTPTPPPTPMPDREKPQVLGFDRSNITIKAGEAVTISYSVKDSGGAGLKQIELWRSLNNRDWAEVTGARRYLSGNGPVSGTFIDRPQSAGTYYYGLHVVDNAGNWDGENGPKRVSVENSFHRQYGAVSGRVHINSPTGAGIADAKVSIGGKSVMTSGDGSFKLEDIPTGSHKLEIAKSGYEPYQMSVSLGAGQKINVGERWLVANDSKLPSLPSQLNIYFPNLNNPAYSAASGNPFAKAGNGGQCTAFVWGRALELTGQRLDTTKHGKYWYIQTNFKKGNSPKPRSIAVWDGVENTYGHVAFVESVIDNGSLIINEANVNSYRKEDKSNYGGGYDGKPKVLSPQQISYRKSIGKLIGYIYLD